MSILNIIGLIAFILMAVFMHFLIKEISKKNLLSWKGQPLELFILYVIGVLPCILIVGIFIARIVK